MANQVINGAIITGSQVNVQTGAVLTSPTLKGTVTSTAALNMTGDLALTGELAHDTGNLGFFGATTVAQQSALTTQHASLTQAGTDSADTTIQAATNIVPYGFVNAGEFEAVVASLINLMTRVQELEDKLQAYGLLA